MNMQGRKPLCFVCRRAHGRIHPSERRISAIGGHSEKSNPIAALKAKKAPSQNRTPLVFACAGGISPPVMYGMGRPRRLGGRFERLFYLHSVLTELTLPVRRGLVWELILQHHTSKPLQWALAFGCSPHLMYTLYYTKGGLSILF